MYKHDDMCMDGWGKDKHSSPDKQHMLNWGTIAIKVCFFIYQGAQIVFLYVELLRAIIDAHPQLALKYIYGEENGRGNALYY